MIGGGWHGQTCLSVQNNDPHFIEIHKLRMEQSNR